MSDGRSKNMSFGSFDSRQGTEKGFERWLAIFMRLRFADSDFEACEAKRFFE
jgi:hypothetical protein